MCVKNDEPGEQNKQLSCELSNDPLEVDIDLIDSMVKGDTSTGVIMMGGGVG